MLGSLFLFDTAGTGVAVARGVIVGVGGALAAIILVVGALVARSQGHRTRLGSEGMLGEVGVVRQRLAPSGTVMVRGEHWKAESDEAVDVGERVEVTAVHGLTLTVRRAR
jgi:membrane-bound serine protease (ClpP class)